MDCKPFSPEDVADIKKRVLGLEYRIDVDTFLIIKWLFEYVEKQLSEFKEEKAN